MDMVGVVLGVLLVITALIVVAAFFHQQQRAQLANIQNRLSQLQPDREKAQPEMLRRERAKFLDALMVMEAGLHASRREVLTPEELDSIDTARSSVKALNERLVSLDLWLGAPYDLEWYEVLERVPTIKRLNLTAETMTPQP